MSLPVHDWQFWVATALFAGALLWMCRGALPGSVNRRRRRGRRATLTVKGRTVDR